MYSNTAPTRPTSCRKLKVSCNCTATTGNDFLLKAASGRLYSEPITISLP